MVIRLILRYFANNERLVQRLSESYPIQAAARIVASVIFRGKGIAEDSQLAEKLNPKKLSSFLNRFSGNLKQEFKDAKDKFKPQK